MRSLSHRIYGRYSMVAVAAVLTALLVAPSSVQAITPPVAPVSATGVLGQSDFTSDTNGTTNSLMDNPVGTAIDSVHHRLFVSDEGNNRVLVYSLDSNNQPLDNVADFVLGQPDFTSSNSGLSATELDLDDGSLFYDSDNDRLFVADEDNQRVLIFDTATITNGEAAVNVLGQPDFVTEGTPGSSPNASTVGAPESQIAYDADRQLLFVGTYTYDRIAVFDVNAITNGEDAVYVLGAPDLTTDGGGNTTADEMNADYLGLVYDNVTHRLFVGNHNDNRVLVFDLATITNGEAAVNILGQVDFVTGSGGTTQNLFDSPSALAIDEANQILFVQDGGNERIVMFDVAAITNGENAIGVLGQPDFVTDSYGVTQQAFDLDSDATGMTFDSLTNTLYVADTDNNRIMIFANLYEDDQQPAEPGQNDTAPTPIATLAATGQPISALTIAAGILICTGFATVLLRKQAH